MGPRSLPGNRECCRSGGGLLLGGHLQCLLATLGLSVWVVFVLGLVSLIDLVVVWWLGVVVFVMSSVVLFALVCCCWWWTYLFLI